MDANITAAINNLSAAIDAHISQLNSIEEQLRNAQSLDGSQSTDIADQINALTAKLQGSASTATAAASDGTTDTSATAAPGDNSGGATDTNTATGADVGGATTTTDTTGAADAETTAA